MATSKESEKVVSEPTSPEVYETLKWNGWGEEGVQMTLDYPNKFARHVDGKPIRNILNFLNNEIRHESGNETIPQESPSITFDEAVKKLNAQTLHEEFINEAKKVFDSRQIRTDALSRLTHIAGKNYRDLWRVRKGLVERAPDCIFLPNSHDDCVRVVNLAHKHNVVLIPFGGGTTVTGGVEANPLERRMVVSVDMRRMNKLIKIDKESMLATVEAGIAGPELDKILHEHGFTCGHDPDSFVYSTLGGWISARGSGAMSNQYGDIEDMVIAMKVATPTGVVETPITSRTCGVDLNGIFIGSEGAFGIITEATIKLEPLPEHTYYGGYLFPNFEAAFNAFRECMKSNARPCVMRLYDEDDFRLSVAMSTSEHSAFTNFVTAAVKTYLSKYKG